MRRYFEQISEIQTVKSQNLFIVVSRVTQADSFSCFEQICHLYISEPSPQINSNKKLNFSLSQ